MQKFSDEERERYQRHFSLPGFGEEKQSRLREATVLIVGVGGLGCPALQYLAAAGVGHIILIDPDCVESSNLQRQILYGTADIGEKKVRVAQREAQRINPLIKITGVSDRLSNDNAREWIRSVDVVLDGSDNLQTRYVINDACRLEGKPWIYGAVSTFTGQLSVFNYQNGPTYRCLYPEPPEEGEVESCSEVGVLGVLPGLIGNAQAIEAIKILTHIGKPLSGRVWIWDTLEMESYTISLEVNEEMRALRGIKPVENTPLCGEGSSRVIGALSEDEVKALAGNQKIIWVDVREERERERGCIPGSLHWPYSSLLKNEARPEHWDESAIIILYCTLGRRSRHASEFLRGNQRGAGIYFLKDGYNAVCG